MSFSTHANITSALMEVVKAYKQELAKPVNFLSEVFHYHEKNPDSSLHITLLEEAEKYITMRVPSDEKYKAQLGMLLILRDLLIDPNRDNEVFSYLIKALNLDETINHVLKKISRGLVFDLSNDNFLKLSKHAVALGQSIINSDHLRMVLPEDFIQYMNNILFVEKEYTDKVLYTIEISKRP